MVLNDRTGERPATRSAAVTITSTNSAPATNTGQSTSGPASISMRPAIPNGPSVANAIDETTAKSAAVRPVTAPRTTAAAEASWFDMPSALRVGPSNHSRRLWRETAWPANTIAARAVITPKSIVPATS